MRTVSPLIAASTFAAALVWSGAASAHCDTLDGPVVASAREALDTGNLNPVLAWVRPDDEALVRSAFDRTRVVRAAGREAKELADGYFYETLVRVHRAGEGAPYTGLKPAGQVEPAVALADKAIASGRLELLARPIAERTEQGLHRRFESLLAKRIHEPNDVEAGRAYVSAYVEFVHYAERLYEAPATVAADPVRPAAADHAH